MADSSTKCNTGKDGWRRALLKLANRLETTVSALLAPMG